jgi:hypothetical protein
MRSFVIFLLTNYYSCDEVENKMGGACSIYGGEKIHTGFGLENLKE